MKVELKLIDESIFNGLDSEIIFNTEHPRCYGILANKNYSLKFGWQSDIIICFSLTLYLFLYIRLLL